MTQPAPQQQTQQQTQLPADQVIEALGAVHAEAYARMAAELAQLRVVLRLRDEELAYLRSLQPAEQAAS